jgi:ATP-dependent DNA helicase RecQ
MQPPDDRALRILRERFGHADFRGRQREAVEAVLSGRDLLLTMPTGSGKSLAYQIPALILDGLVLVVSPLIALMKDQEDDLRERGIRAAAVHSNLSPGEREERLAAAERGRLDLLLVTPERFRSPRFQEALPRLGVARLAVDEAHCISQWGHDFRPDYHRLREYRRWLGDPPTLALTATATPRVARDIVQCLGLRDPVVIRSGIERENLFLAVQPVEEEEGKLPLLLRRIAEIGGAGIVYSALIRDLERLHVELARRGVHSLVYHGKLSDRERRSMQDRFMRSDDEVVLATNAFGMGVDKADIRFVIHAQVPRTLEAWAQEIGRAGRDGDPSWCELLYFEEDVAIQQEFVAWANPSREYLLGVYECLRAWGERIQAKDLDDLRDELLVKNQRDNRVSIALKWLEVLGVVEGRFENKSLRLVRELDPALLPAFVGSPEKHREDLTGLLAMVRFATDRATCRRDLLGRHFELPGPGAPCGACDACADPEAWRAARLRPRAVASRSASREAAFERGDWVRVGGRLGQVLQVSGRGRRLKLVVEDARSLERRSVDPARQAVVRLEGRDQRDSPDSAMQ